MIHEDVLASGIRRYSGERSSHAHEHVQIMFALRGRMELEIGGHGAFVDSSCGMLIPAGVEHGFWAAPEVRMFVLDVPPLAGLDQVRRFAVTPACRQSVELADVGAQIAQLLQAPRVLARRGIDLAQLDGALAGRLHESWPTARMAQLFCLSAPRFHARLLELTGLTPQAYLRGRRLDGAQHLLRQGMALEASALQVGYRSASALSFALKRERQFSTRRLRHPRLSTDES